jgi:uncharacterized membrane protein
MVMALMALDHVRDFFSNADFNPTDAEHTTPAYFLTRWVTHLCASVFMLLAGTAIALRERRVGRPGLPTHVVKRGVFLILLEVTIVHVAWKFDLHYPVVRLMVLWALGGSMVVLAALLAMRLSPRAITLFGLVVVAGHNLLDAVHATGVWRVPWSMLHEVDMHPLVGAHRLLILYPLVPWIGVIALGYGLGSIMDGPAERRRRLLLGLGVACMVCFVALRLANGYGDPTPWTTQPRGSLYTVLSFFDLQKYPPSLDYLLATLGIALVLLAALEHLGGWVVRMLEVLGRVPLFFYVVHLYLIHTLRWLIGREFALPGVYAVWIVVVMALIAPCVWFGRLKARRRDLAWLSYL